MGERQQTVQPEEMATTSTAVTTVPQPLQEDSVERVAVITLRPTAPAARTETRKKVVWTEDTVDNEDMNKKKSKCCCVYVKPRKFDESDSESSDSECEHCFGHVEKKRAHRAHAPPAAPAPPAARQLTITDAEETDTPVPTATITLQPPEPAPADPAPSPPDKSLPAS